MVQKCQVVNPAFWSNTQSVLFIYFTMKLLYYTLGFSLLFSCTQQPAVSQTVDTKTDFRLASPNNEPDGRNDVVKVSSSEFVTLAKVKGSTSGKSDFMLEKYNNSLKPVWQTPLSVEGSEDFKELYYNGKDLMLLSVIHDEAAKKTKMVAYVFDVASGKKTNTKDLESYDVSDYETHMHKGKVKECFVDVICEHANQNFVTPFEYKHNVIFSPDQKKFISYVYNYGEKNLTASVSVYDDAGNALSKGKVSIDNDYTNHGIYVDNAGAIYLLNASNMGKVNLIKYDLVSKNFEVLEIPATSYQKDDFHVQFVNDHIYIANTEIANEKVMGIKYVKINYAAKEVVTSVIEEFSNELKMEVASERKMNKTIKGEDDWRDYDIVNFIVETDGSVLVALEKRSLYADGYPHIKKDAFDKSHKVELDGHIHTEGIILLAFDDKGARTWQNYIAKNQVYPAYDGMNSVSFIMENSPSKIKLLYAYSETGDALLYNMNVIYLDKKTGKPVLEKQLPNNDKLVLMKDYTVWNDDSVIIVGKKGILGKASMIVRYKL